MTRPACPAIYNGQINHWLLRLRTAMEDGDTNPHLVMRDILGEVYAQGHNDGYTASLFDRPLDTYPPASSGVPVARGAENEGGAS